MRLGASHRRTVAQALATVPGLTKEPVQCAWCRPTCASNDKAGLVSHGVCAKHAAELEQDLPTPRARSIE
jgi:hypothetical protein